jgi:hypothetical protein
MNQQVTVLGNAQFTDFLTLSSSGAPTTIDFFSTATLKDITNTVNITGDAPSYPLGASEVPEPSTLLLTAGAGVAVLFSRRRTPA